VRKDVYQIMMEEDVSDSALPKQVMQKAYCTYATVPSKGLQGEGDAVRSRWADLVNDVAIKHGKYINDMQKGIFYENIDKDPRDSRESDEKTDITQLPGFVQRQPTGVSGENRNQVPVSKTADKYIQKLQ